METQNRHNKQSEHQYRRRIMASIIVVELLLIGLFNLWPVTQETEVFQANITETDVTSVIEAPVVTYQSGAPQPPPAPQTPVEVPNDVILKHQEIKFLEFSNIGEADTISVHPGTSDIGTGKVYKTPELAPSILYIVEPTIENKTDNKALIYVKFLVDKKGNVDDAIISRILLFDEEGKPTIEVRDISERVLSAVINAALQWKFRPAKVNGEPVRAWTLNTFTVDY